MTRLFSFFVTIIFVFNQNLNANENYSKVCHYYCTAANSDFFHILMGLIGSIHKVDFDSLDEIAVFDIGLTLEQRKTIQSIEKTNVYQIEKINPDLFTKFKTNPAGRTLPGWQTWKPILIKQALEMFPYFLYLDAGTLVISSTDNLFKHIKQNGYFLLHVAPHNLVNSITKPVVDKLLSTFSREQKEFILNKNTSMLDSGIQGISKKIYGSYVLPVYKLVNDLSLFADDGSALLGFGYGRHEQTLYSIFAHIGKLDLNSQGWSQIKVDGKNVAFHLHYHPSEITNKTCIYHSRSDYQFGGDKKPFIHWKNPSLHTDKNNKE
ncbi:MAG: hypothetical protein K1060chlam1_00628 [Candidatus Anoxychlamydiales bacterium]|nr:hypothetical protein [Candidatus Anoxychlamydiales bacterium]